MTMLQDTPGLLTALAFVLGYLFGAIPFGLLLTRAAGLGDIRAIGSGNIGATNVLRTGNKALAAGTLALDVLKGLVPILAAGTLWAATQDGPVPSSVAIAAGLGAFIGHCFPIWLGFKGGKGVATCIGVLIGWAWPAALAFCAIWLATAATSRLSSLSALVAAAATPVVLYGLSAPLALVAAAAGLSTILIAKHHANISRLMSGSEPKIGAKT